MAVETRHTEKTILFDLLLIDDRELIISKLKATMEPEDVQLVEKQVADYKSSRDRG